MALCLLVGSLQAPAALAQDPPYGKLLWNGNDPFHQPVATTNYYGSGDINGDGSVTSADVALAEAMAAGTAPMRIPADVDGDRDVDATDVALLEQVLAGGTLPAWWNRLTTREQRESWALKVMKLDATNEHTAWSYWFQCLGFSTQTFIHSAYYRGDLQGTYFEGGPTVFNVPMYPVGVSSLDFGHAINGILVGDDPLSFDDWLFLEPQTDEVVLPGMWDMPFGNEVSIFIPYRISRGGAWAENKIRFEVHEGGWSLLESSPDLLLARGNPGPPSLDDRWDQWNPSLVPTPTGLLLFQQARDDATRTTDIHLQELRACGAPPAPRVLTSAPQYSRLLDAYRDAGGEIHLLWEGKTEYVPGVFYGRLSNDLSSILEVARVSEGNRSVRMGRVAVTAAGERHVFWLEEGGSNEIGIYWSKRSGGTWLPAQNLAALGFSLFDFSEWWRRRNVLRYYFDVEPIGDRLVLAWNEPMAQSSDDFSLKFRSYDGAAWGNPVTLGNAGSAGVALGTDGTRMYLVDSAPGTNLVENRGNLRARTSNDGINWSAPGFVDASAQACCPRMASSGGEAVLIWDRRAGERSVPVWSRNSGLGWSAGQQLDPGAGNDAWFPTVSRLPGGEVIAAWSSRSTTLHSITVASLAGQSPCPAPPTVSAVSPNNGPTAGGTAVTITGTHFEPGASVAFGGVPAGSVVFVNDTTLTAITPAHATGAVAAAVTTDHGTGSKVNAFFYTPPRVATDFYSLPPCRALDTRNPNGPLGGPVLSPGQQRLFKVSGICGIPADADAISVNVTVVSPGAPGYFAFYPGNAFPLGTSTINFSAGQTRANNAILSLATDGTGNLGVQNASAGSSHLIVDVNGYFLE